MTDLEACGPLLTLDLSPLHSRFVFFLPLNIQLYLGTHSVKSTSWVMNIPINKVQGMAVTSSNSLELTMELVFPTSSK